MSTIHLIAVKDAKEEGILKIWFTRNFLWFYHVLDRLLNNKAHFNMTNKHGDFKIKSNFILNLCVHI